MPQKRMECIRLLLEHLAWIEHRVIHQSWLAKGLGLGLLCWGFKGVQGEIPSDALFKSGQWHFHQDNASVHNSILVTDYLTKMGIKTVLRLPFVPNLLLWLWVIPWTHRRLWDSWEDERGCAKGHWYAHTRGLLWSLPEVVGTVKQVHCRRRRLFRRGLEFHVCTINKSAHTTKVWKLI